MLLWTEPRGYICGGGSFGKTVNSLVEKKRGCIFCNANARAGHGAQANREANTFYKSIETNAPRHRAPHGRVLKAAPVPVQKKERAMPNLRSAEAQASGGR